MTTPLMNFIGINVSGEHVRAALVDEHGSILDSRIGGVATELIPQLTAMVGDLRSASGSVCRHWRRNSGSGQPAN